MDYKEYLADVPTDVLKDEITRRAIEACEKKALVKRCRMCKHHGTISFDGRVIEKPMVYDRCCPKKAYLYKKTGRMHYRSMNPSTLACEHFDERENTIKKD